MALDFDHGVAQVVEVSSEMNQLGSILEIDLPLGANAVADAKTTTSVQERGWTQERDNERNQFYIDGDVIDGDIVDSYLRQWMGNTTVEEHISNPVEEVASADGDIMGSYLGLWPQPIVEEEVPEVPAPHSEFGSFDPCHATLTLPGTGGWTKTYKKRRKSTDAVEESTKGARKDSWDISLKHPLVKAKIRSNIELVRFCRQHDIAIDPAVVNCCRMVPTEAEENFKSATVQRLIKELGPRLYRPLSYFSLCEYAFVPHHLWPSYIPYRVKKVKKKTIANNIILPTLSAQKDGEITAQKISVPVQSVSTAKCPVVRLSRLSESQLRRYNVS